MRLENYWWLLLWPILFGGLRKFLYTQTQENGDESQLQWTPMEAIIMAVPFVLWAGWRRHFGDTEVYRKTFLSLPDSLDQISPYLKTVEKGRGFRLFEMLFRCFISHSDIAFFTFVAAIQLLCLIYVYRRYSPDYWFSFFLFVASTDYLLWMHNGIRQFISASIIFLCVPLIAKKRYALAIIIIILAAQIHAGALIFLPFVFIVNGKAWNFRTLLFLFIIVVLVVYVNHITDFLIDALEDTAYSGDIIFLKENNGTNVLRAIFYSVPALMSLLFLSHLDNADNPLMNVCANLSIVTAGFYFFSIFSSGVLMGAIPIYFSLSNYILIPWLLKEAFNRESANAMRVIFIIAYIIFFYIQCGPTWGLL